MIDNNVFVKILQIPGDEENKLFNREKRKAIGLIDAKGVSPVKNNQATKINNNQQPNFNNNANRPTVQQTSQPAQKK